MYNLKVVLLGGFFLIEADKKTSNVYINQGIKELRYVCTMKKKKK